MARGHHKTQRYLRAIWRLTRISCDLTWSWGDDKWAQRTEPRATVHGTESQTHLGPRLRCQAPGSSLLSWRPWAEAMTAPDEKAAPVSEELGEAPPHLRAHCSGLRAPGLLPAPSTSLRLFTAGSQRAACTRSYPPPPPVPLEADLIQVSPAPKQTSCKSHPPPTCFPRGSPSVSTHPATS